MCAMVASDAVACSAHRFEVRSVSFRFVSFGGFSRCLDCPALIVIPCQVNKCKDFGVNVVQHGMHILDAKEHAVSAPQFQVGLPPPLRSVGINGKKKLQLAVGSCATRGRWMPDASSVVPVALATAPWGTLLHANPLRVGGSRG